MRRADEPGGDDRPVIEVELVESEPEVVAGGAADRDSAGERLRRAARRIRRSARRRIVLLVSAVAVFAVGLAGMRMWDDRAAERARDSTVAASITLAQSGSIEPANLPVTGLANGSIQAVVHNAGPVPFSLLDVGADVPNVRITATRVVGEARIGPGENGQFDISFITDCSKAQPTDPSTGYPDESPIRMTLRVRTAAQQVRTVVIPVPQPDPSATGLWSESIQFACGGYAQSPVTLTWPDGASGFPAATVRGVTATIAVSATLMGSNAATLGSFDAMPGVVFQAPGLPLTLKPNAPTATLAVTARVTDCDEAGSQPQYPILDARVVVSGVFGGAASYVSQGDGRITLALEGAIARICGS